MPWCCGPGSWPGSAVKLGKRSSATLILTDALSYEMRPTASRNAGGSVDGSRNRSNVRCISTPLAMLFAAYSSPLRRATPVAAPRLVRIFTTSALVLISTPRSVAARASACVSPPMPPRMYAHTPRFPFVSPIT